MVKIIRSFIFIGLFLISLNSWSEDLKFFHYTNEHGLPSSYVKDITQDHLGFIWIATRNSVTRFDGSHFKNFPAIDHQGNLADIWGMKFIHSCDSSLIVQSTDKGYYSFNFALEQFEPCGMLDSLEESVFISNSDGGVWVNQGGKIFYLDTERHVFLTIEEKIDFANIGEEIGLNHIREQDNLVVAITSTRNFMIFDLKLRLQREFDIAKEIDVSRIANLYLDKNNNAWITEYANGVFKVNLTNGRTSHFSYEQSGNRHILHNFVHDVNEDELGRIWIGTENGLCIWSPYTETFSYHQPDIKNPKSLNTNSIYNIFCDREGNMWLGTYFGGINFWRSNPDFFKYWKAGLAAHHITGSAVSCFAEDKEGNIWLGMEDAGVNCIDIQKEIITQKINESTGLTYNNVHDILIDTDDRMWIGTYSGGINILNLSSGKLDYLNVDNCPALHSDNIFSFLQVADSIFISTSQGITVYNLKSKKLSRFMDEVFGTMQIESMFDASDRMWFSTGSGIYLYDKETGKIEMFDKFSNLNCINLVKVDSKGRIWAGDFCKGLWGYDFIKDTLYNYSEQNGFPFTWIFSMEEGSDGNFWVSGDKGLVKFNPDSNNITWFNRESGLPFEQFNYRASFIDKKGNMYFGGNIGMISFNDRLSLENRKYMKVVFTGFQLFNQELKPGQASTLNFSLNEHPEINLKYKENVFTIEYSALNYQNQGNSHYAYYLEGFESDWSYVGNRNFATYTNLNPGTYYFHVKASLGNNQWDNNYNTLKIVVDPPFWLSIWGYLIYFVLAGLLAWGFAIISSKIRRSRLQVEIERRERTYITDVSNFKLEFFTNISHELRTPLTLIIGPLSRILEEEKLTPALSKKMKGVKNNAERLLSLINQLLDFRKIEMGKEMLKVSYQDIDYLLKNIENLFSDAAKDKGIELDFYTKNLNSYIWIDGKKFETILVNLISNALKFTNEGGKVSIIAELLEGKESNEDKKNLQCVIKDNGVGIELSKLNRIFERFYRADTAMNNNNRGGSGIGLAIANSLVKMHKGDIQVNSEIGKGTEFTINIPVAKSNYTNEEIVLAELQCIQPVLEIQNEKTTIIPNDEAQLVSKKPKILVIDDNRELLDFITETLIDTYCVITAADGAQGIEKAVSTSFDLIVSDVMMPYIDGFELTRKLKSDMHTSHIPIILLTAKTGDESKWEGLQTGADYYIEKPFLPHILIQLIENVLKTRENLYNRFRSDLSLLPKDVAFLESDRELIDKITKLVEKNIDLPNLDVQFIIDEVGISRSLLHLKLKKLTGCSATEFVRSIRLRAAAKLIADGKCNISEAAYQTGFSTPAYFSHRFKEYFGKSPKEYFDV
jgi:signal transduction histidine kinase/ligand-binding sensor domain-containing protein/DNA-binding response OmpR family regulator